MKIFVFELAKLRGRHAPLIDKTGQGEGKVPTVGRKMWEVRGGLLSPDFPFMGGNAWGASFLKSAKWRDKIP